VEEIVMATTKDRKVTIDQDLVIGHVYEVAVRAVASDGRTQAVDLAPKKTLLLAGVTRSPAAPTALTATPFLYTIFLAWTNPTNADFDVTEVYRNTVNVVGTATKIGEVRTDTFVDNVGTTETTMYYWVKARNTSRVKSSWNSLNGAAATTQVIEATGIADFTVTATKMFTKAIVLSADTWTNNSPTAGKIAWNSHVVVYNGVSYPITGSNTASRYVYWVVGDATYTASATHPVLGTTGFVVATNEAGVTQTVWNSSANMVIGNAFIGNLDAGKITSGSLAVTYTDAKCPVANADNTATVLTAKGIADGATVGATWGTNVASIPVRLTEDDTPAASGVYITPNYIGFYDTAGGGVWPVRIKNNAGAGEFFVGEATKYMAYTVATGLVVLGKIQTALTGTRMILDNADNTLKLYVGAEASPRIAITDDEGPGGAPAIFCNGYIISANDLAMTHWGGLVGNTLVMDNVEIVNAARAIVGVTGITVASGNITLSGAGATVDGVDVSAHAGNAAIHGGGTVTSVTAGTGLSGGAITSSGTIAVNYGSTNVTACVGNDARLSDARTPSSTLAHAASHVSGAGDALSGTLAVNVSGSSASCTGNAAGSSASCTGNAATATKLAATKTINGVAFDGSANINVPTQYALTFSTGLSSSGTFDGSAARTLTVDLGTGAAQAAYGNHDHTGVYAAVSHGTHVPAWTLPGDIGKKLTVGAGGGISWA
jgi:hypothetical protein